MKNNVRIINSLEPYQELRNEVVPSNNITHSNDYFPFYNVGNDDDSNLCTFLTCTCCEGLNFWIYEMWRLSISAMKIAIQ